MRDDFEVGNLILQLVDVGDAALGKLVAGQDGKGDAGVLGRFGAALCGDDNVVVCQRRLRGRSLGGGGRFGRCIGVGERWQVARASRLAVVVKR
jgi:hypothetical protein